MVTEYAGNYVYKNSSLEFFNQAEGYVEKENNTYKYVYQYKDHLGNVRLSYSDLNNNGTIEPSSEILDEKNYYPFGLEHSGYNNLLNGTKNNLKTYQKQEFTEDLGLNTHEWKYRISDPAIGRFWQIDPLAEDYPYNSTYAFQENKLGMGIELEGKELQQFIPWLTADAVAHPNGIGAHTLGFAKGLGNSIEGAYNAVTNPKQTLQGLGNMLVVGAANGDPLNMMAMDNALGTNSFGTSMAMGQAIENGVDALVNGNGLERGEVIGEIAGTIAIGEGAGAALKGAGTLLKGSNVANPIPSTLARVIPGDVKTTTLGAASASDVFVTGASDISGLNAAQIAKKTDNP